MSEFLQCPKISEQEPAPNLSPSKGSADGGFPFFWTKRASVWGTAHIQSSLVWKGVIVGVELGSVYTCLQQPSDYAVHLSGHPRTCLACAAHSYGLPPCHLVPPSEIWISLLAALNALGFPVPWRNLCLWQSSTLLDKQLIWRNTCHLCTEHWAKIAVIRGGVNTCFGHAAGCRGVFPLWLTTLYSMYLITPCISLLPCFPFISLLYPTTDTGAVMLLGIRLWMRKCSAAGTWMQPQLQINQIHSARTVASHQHLSTTPFQEFPLIVNDGCSQHGNTQLACLGLYLSVPASQELVKGALWIPIIVGQRGMSNNWGID